MGLIVSTLMEPLGPGQEAEADRRASLKLMNDQLGLVNFTAELLCPCLREWGQCPFPRNGARVSMPLNVLYLDLLSPIAPATAVGSVSESSPICQMNRSHSGNEPPSDAPKA